MKLTKFLILFSVVFALGVVAYDQEAFGILGCDNPHCYALQQTSRSTSIQGIEYELDSPDLWVDRTACANIAVSTGWLVANTLSGNSGHEWVESGVTKGHIENVGCVTLLSTYYAFNNLDSQDRPTYQEYLVPNGRVDPGDDITVKIQKHGANQVQVYVTTPDRTSSFPVAQINLDSRNVYYGDYGIEGTISATDEYSSIPMSKFTNMKIKQGTTWSNLPASATVYEPDTDEGYLGQECTGNAFVAGSVTSLDCDVVATRNQIPTVSTQVVNVNTNAPKTIGLDAIDTDNDYLTYNLVELPTNGFLDHNNKAQKIPNTDGDSASLVYTPANTTPESDTIRYSVTDKRIGHTREGLISIIGPTPADTVPDAVDDFSHTLDGNVITFTWGIPDDGGSEITSFRMERSADTESWMQHNTVSETTTSLNYTRQPGYDQYFRIFAKNAIGYSAASNLVHVHINDNTPPTININSPTNGSIITQPSIPVSGSVSEFDNSGIEYVLIYVDGTIVSDPISTPFVSSTTTRFESSITGLDNGNHTITVKSANGDGATASKSVDITLAVPASTTLDSFAEDFEGEEMSNWILTTEDDEFWSIRASPIEPVPNSKAGNKVGGTEDCDDVCSMIMIDRVDLTGMSEPTLSFYRFVATGADVSNNEGIYVYTSEDDGDTWILLDSFTANESKDDGIWHLEEYSLVNSSSSDFKVKFDARSSSNSEDTELDDVLIYDAAAAVDTTAPVLTVPDDRIFEATGTETPLNNTQIGVATATDDTDPAPVVSNNSTGLFVLGDTAILWTATDDAGNTANATQTITIRDTTPPAVSVQDDIAMYFEPGAAYVVNFDVPAATDTVDGDVAVACDYPQNFAFALGTTTVTCTATDGAGNTATTSFDVTVGSSSFVGTRITPPPQYPPTLP